MAIAGSDIAGRPVALADIDMRKLVAALIAREENALVLREIADRADGLLRRMRQRHRIATARGHDIDIGDTGAVAGEDRLAVIGRSEEHTSALKSRMRIPNAVFCLKKKNVDL